MHPSDNTVLDEIDNLKLSDDEKKNLKFQIRYNSQLIEVDKMTDCKRRFDDTQQQNLLKSVNNNNITHIYDCIDKFNQTEQLDD